jgi:hypothetical protein
MEVSRTSKNKEASIILECDDSIPSEIITLLEQVPNIISVKSIDIHKGDAYV